jgi:hypothetical protein
LRTIASLLLLSQPGLAAAASADTGEDGTLGYYAELLKRVTDSAFKEGEHAE